MVFNKSRDDSRFEEVKKVFQGLKDRLPSEPQLQKQLDEAFIKVLSNKEQDTGMRATIDALNARISQLDKNFDIARDHLHQIDIKYLTNFEPEWKEIRTEWRNFLGKSRDSAIKTQSYIDDFTGSHMEHILKIKTEKDRQDALLELRAFIMKPDPRGRTFPTHGGNVTPNVKESSDDLVKLRKELENFKITFDKFAEEEIIIIEGEVKELKETIAEVVEELKEAVELFEEAEGLLHLTHNIIIAGGLVMVFMHSFPIHILLTLLELITLIGGPIVVLEYMKNIARLQDELTGLYANLAQAEKELELMKSAKTMVDDTSDVSGISSRIDCLDDIWLSVARDADALRQALETGGETFEAIRDRIVQMKAFYDSISVGLAHYSGGYPYQLSE